MHNLLVSEQYVRIEHPPVTQRSGSGSRSGSGRITARSSISRSIGRARSVLCVRPRALSNHASSCNWKSRWFANRRRGAIYEHCPMCVELRAVELVNLYGGWTRGGRLRGAADRVEEA